MPRNYSLAELEREDLERWRAWEQSRPEALFKGPPGRAAYDAVLAQGDAIRAPTAENASIRQQYEAAAARQQAALAAEAQQQQAQQQQQLQLERMRQVGTERR